MLAKPAAIAIGPTDDARQRSGRRVGGIVLRRGVGRRERAVGLIQPSGQADAAGNAIQFRDAEAVVGEQQVGADDAR